MTRGAAVAAKNENRKPHDPQFAASLIARGKLPVEKKTVSSHKRCARCRRMLPASSFPSNARMKSGLGSWCLECVAARNREWRAANPDYVQAANVARRLGPFQVSCVDCGRSFEASRRSQVRCRECQVAMRKARK